jgi:hypothetical protein
MDRVTASTYVPSNSHPNNPVVKPAVEEVVALLAWNLEAHETEAFSRDNGLLAFAAENDRPEFHSSPLWLAPQ